MIGVVQPLGETLLFGNFSFCGTQSSVPIGTSLVHDLMRLNVKINPLKMPNRLTALTEYSEHEGLYLQ